MNDAPLEQADQQDEADASTDGGLWAGILEQIDAIPYAIVGAVFWLAALLSLVYGLVAFVVQVTAQVAGPAGFTPQSLIDKGQGAQDVITLVSDLLLTLIIMEVFGTVVHYLRERETTLKPFLFIGIISATRGILSIGARLAVGSVAGDEFARDMVELGVDGAVIIALGVAMRLIGTFLEQGATPSRGPRRRGRSGRLVARSRSPSSTGAVGLTGWARRVVVGLIVVVTLLILGLVAMLISATHS
jgi:uncharacterized membrane protein (DUF373 family)